MDDGDDNDHDDDARRRSGYVMLLAAAAIVALGGWLVHLSYGYLQQERCQEEGRRDCNVITINGQ